MLSNIVRDWKNTDSSKPGKNNTLQHISSTKKNLFSRLSILDHVYGLLKDVEKEEKWFRFRQDTLEAIFKKYPNMTLKQFNSFFLIWIYNKNILMNNPEILDLLDLENINPWDDLIAIVIEKISLSKKEFEKKTLWKFDVLTFPNLSSTDIAQWYLFEKLKSFLPWTQIIFWDMCEIRDFFWINQFNSDSVWFIDLMWNGLFNTCLFKMLKTAPNIEKLRELNHLFSLFELDIFIGWSTFNIPFKIPANLQAISMPKMSLNNNQIVFRNNVLMNSMGYLNSAYYAEKVRWSFVLWTHNIAEPMHAGKLTVISNDLENRYNHNWIISYFWEKTGLLLYFNSSDEDQIKVDKFLTIDKEELQKRYKDFQSMYESKIIKFIYWIFYRFLLKSFPEKFN